MFFGPDVTVHYDSGHKYHLFKCGARICHTKGSVRRYLDKGDCSLTSNLHKHAIHCFGEDAVLAATTGASSSHLDGSIHAAFGWQGSQPVFVTHRAHSNPQIRLIQTILISSILISVFFRANLVHWVTESNCSIQIVEDCKFCDLMLAGHPQANLPGCQTVAHDIKASFEHCEECINKLLQVCTSCE